MNTQQQHSHGDDLQWQAFLYVAEEMPAKDREAFEERMITDLAACEAVASQVQLCGSVFAAESLTTAPQPAQTTSPQRKPYLRFALTFAATAAACVVAFVAGGWLNTGGQPVAAPGVARPADAGELSAELAAQWSAARQEIVEDNAWRESLTSHDPPSEAGSQPPAAARPAAAGPSAPSWMFAAVAQHAEDGDIELEN